MWICFQSFIEWFVSDLFRCHYGRLQIWLDQATLLLLYSARGTFVIVGFWFKDIQSISGPRPSGESTALHQPEGLPVLWWLSCRDQCGPSVVNVIETQHAARFPRQLARVCTFANSSEEPLFSLSTNLKANEVNSEKLWIGLKSYKFDFNPVNDVNVWANIYI